MASTIEGGLWDVSEKAEIEAKALGDRITDEALGAYVRSVACRVATVYCDELRVYVMDRPIFNASMAPNGYMEVWSGLLLRAENEAQLAFVLGHETGHYLENHSVEAFREFKSRMTGAMIAGIALGGGLLSDLVYLGTVASLFGFSRENETEADSIGVELAVAAGYAPSAAPALWRNLIAETAQSDDEKTRKREARGSAFSTHPLSQERVAALEAQVSGKSGGELGAERHRAAIRPFLQAWLRNDLRRRDFGQTLFLVDRLAANGADLGVLEFIRGEAYRLRRGEGDAAKAEASYLAAAAHADAPAETWRNLGEIHERAARREEAVRAYQTYLAANYTAPDRALIERRVLRLQGGSTP